MYQHLSETAKEVIKLADEIARRAHLDYVGTEHVLLGIMEHGLGLGAQVLQNAGITLELLKESIQQVNRSSSEDTWVFGRLPGSPHFKQVIANAIEEAELVRQKKVGTEFLLLGLLRETDCIAEKILRGLGLTLSQARQEISRLQGRPQ